MFSKVSSLNPRAHLSSVARAISKAVPLSASASTVREDEYRNLPRSLERLNEWASTSRDSLNEAGNLQNLPNRTVVEIEVELDRKYGKPPEPGFYTCLRHKKTGEFARDLLPFKSKEEAQRFVTWMNDPKKTW